MRQKFCTRSYVNAIHFLDAYLKVVRQHHPDVSEAPESAEKFRRAQEAFEALSNSLENTVRYL